MLRRYVINWIEVLAVYARLKGSITVVFRDGYTCPISFRGAPKSEVASYLDRPDIRDFYEHLYSLHNRDHGIRYLDPKKIVIDAGIGLDLHDWRYSRVIDEVFVERIYDITPVDGKVVIDVGASVGDTAIHFASLGAKVYAFEPDQDRFRLAVQNVRDNSMEGKIELYCKTVSSVGDFLEICDDNEDIEVFLKMDCEGCEYEVLRDPLPHNIRSCVLEYHRQKDVLVDLLRGQGFKTKAKGELLYALR